MTAIDSPTDRVAGWLAVRKLTFVPFWYFYPLCIICRYLLDSQDQHVSLAGSALDGETWWIWMESRRTTELRNLLGRGHQQCFQGSLLIFKKINIFYGAQFAVFLVSLNDCRSQNSDRMKKFRTIFEHPRFIFAAMLSVVRNAIKVFQFVMNKDWLLFFYPGQNFYSSFYSYSKPNLCLTVQKSEIKCWIFSHAERWDVFAHK